MGRIVDISKQDLINTIKAIQPGRQIRYTNKTFNVAFVTAPVGAMHRVELVMLEEGKPASEVVAGRFLAQGQTFTRDNHTHITLYAQPGYMSAIELLPA